MNINCNVVVIDVHTAEQSYTDHPGQLYVKHRTYCFILKTEAIFRGKTSYITYVVNIVN